MHRRLASEENGRCGIRILAGNQTCGFLKRGVGLEWRLQTAMPKNAMARAGDPGPKSTRKTRERRYDPADETDRLPASPELLKLPGLLAASLVEIKLVLSRILRGHRAHAGARKIPSRVLRRPARDPRPLRRRFQGNGAPRYSSHQAGPDCGRAHHGTCDEAARDRLHLLDDLL